MTITDILTKKEYIGISQKKKKEREYAYIAVANNGRWEFVDLP